MGIMAVTWIFMWPSLSLFSWTATPGLLEECWQLASQLARDDYASIGSVGLSDSGSAIGAELPPIDEHSADWSCIAVALGPLFCLYSRMLRSSSHVTDSDLKERRNLSENGRIADQACMINRLIWLKLPFLKSILRIYRGNKSARSIKH